MKRIFFLFKLFFPLLLFAFEAGFDEHYYKLDAEQRRKLFIAKIDALLDFSFEKIKEEQLFIENFFQSHIKSAFRNIKAEELSKLLILKEKYRVKNLFDYQAYMKKIDFLPKSMAIAQAMVESGTGTSRFARRANNLFGERTWGEKGLIPRQRTKGETHKIRIFDNLQESVDSYVLNLNRHNAYEDFRSLRQAYKQRAEKLSGLKAIETLRNYSELKDEYVKILENVIKKYELYHLD